MALILEIRDVRGHPAWHPLDRLPLTLGRALSNDIIVDDPYVDAVHARISLDDSGAVVIEDAGTINGIIVNQARTEGPIRMAAGIQLRMGRTSLSVRARNEQVPAALYDDPGEFAGAPLLPVNAAAMASVPVAASNPSGSRLKRGLEWALETTRGRVVTIGAMLAMVALTSLLGHTEKDLGQDVFIAVLASAGVLLVWSWIWALATRGADRRLRLPGHLAVAALVTLVLIAYGALEDWLRFMFPDAGILEVISWCAMLASLAWLVAAHLAVPKVLSRKRRWRAGLIVSGVLLAIAGVGTLLGNDEFSDVPTFPKQLKRMPAALVPSTSTEQFLDVMRDVKARADEAATTEPAR